MSHTRISYVAQTNVRSQSFTRVHCVFRWVMSHIWMCHVTHLIESCHTHAWVMSHTWMHHVTNKNELFHTKKCTIAILYSRPLCFQVSHVTHMNESCQTHEWVMSHTWMSHVTHRNTSCHTHECVMSGIWMHHVTPIHASCHLHECETSHMCHTYETHMNHTCNKLPTCSLICVSQFDMCVRPTQSIMYDPLQVNRFQKHILLIVQYKYLKLCSRDFYSPESDPPHKIMRYWFYYSI